MQRGEVWFAKTPGGDRPVLVLTRDPVADRIGSVVVAALDAHPSGPGVGTRADSPGRRCTHRVCCELRQHPHSPQDRISPADRTARCQSASRGLRSPSGRHGLLKVGLTDFPAPPTLNRDQESPSTVLQRHAKMNAEAVWYLDSSAIVKLVAVEAEPRPLLHFLRRRQTVASSALATLGDRFIRAEEVLDRIELVRVGNEILEQAGGLEPATLSTPPRNYADVSAAGYAACCVLVLDAPLRVRLRTASLPSTPPTRRNMRP